jgi:DNA repair protein RadC
MTSSPARAVHLVERPRQPIAPRSRPVLKYGDLPRSERPMQRLIHHGVEPLSNEEILTLVINAGRDGDVVGGIIPQLLAMADGRIRRLGKIAAPALQRVHGVGPARAARLLAAFELARRCLDEPTEERPRVRSPIDIVMRFTPQLRDLAVTEFHLVALDTQHGITRTIALGRDDSRSAMPQPRVVFREAIKEGGAAFILVHNHPSGDPAPSHEEVAFTERLYATAQTTEMPLYDHIIIGRNHYYSFLEERWLQPSPTANHATARVAEPA